MANGTVRLWWTTVSDFISRLDELEDRLSEDERQRADRFRVAAARHRFVLSRALLRHTLAAVLGVEADALVFGRGDRGKPYLVAPLSALPVAFNLSHSGAFVALAVAPTEVGVDVESLRLFDDADRLARRFLSAAEQAAVLAVEGSARDRRFLRIWTQKEAYLKATGLGVGMPLREVETEPDPARPPRLLAVAGDRHEAGRWTLAEAEIPDAVCVVAIMGGTRKLVIDRVTSWDDLRI